MARGTNGAQHSAGAGGIKPDKAIPRIDKASQENEAGHTQPTQDDNVAQEASKKNATTTWWRRGFKTQSSSKPENNHESSKAEVLFVSNTNYHDTGD